MDLITQLQSGCYQDQSTADAFRTHTLDEPETGDVDEILGMEIEDGLLGLKVIQDVLDSDGHICVAGVVERREEDGGVLIAL